MDNTGTIIGLVGVYLTLVSIIGSLFFVQLAGWYRQIVMTESKWLRFGLDARATDKHVECYLEALDEAGPQPLIGSTLFVAFLLIMFVFSVLVSSSYSGDTKVTRFLLLPLYIFSALIFVVCAAYLSIGYPKVKRLLLEIKIKLGIA
jgi:hypothetical protein